jgi:hypothetical protein
LEWVQWSENRESPPSVGGLYMFDPVT